MIDNKDLVEFRCVGDGCELSGYMYLEDADSERPFIFYDHNGFEIDSGRLPSNPFNEDTEPNEWRAWESLIEAVTTDDMLIQYLYDLHTEVGTIRREYYLLAINC